ncbi:hypothetical protein EV421DRAFT_1815371 [Armillaria borealis]|uniref:Uncharacterized protein n=1 Tax=Armillaria borealis TaxID=47425 RepID=A0AA39JCZ4_9AGAR|nr:hypothetical protein EV421DRAFT_1815371 [Armillaria borealis]
MQTGFQAILSPLPPIRGSAPGNYTTASSSGQSTSLKRPPKTITTFPAQDTFQALLQRLNGLGLVLNQPIFRMLTEQSHHLITEGDVERASALYLLHDVNLIIENYLVNQLGLPALTIECLAQSTGGRSRPDIKYMVGNVVVLIVEFKNVNTLHDNDWTYSALVRNGRTAKDIVKGLRRDAKTALTGNAVILSQQAVKYSESCPIIVLCNYQNMIVLDFAPGQRPFHNENNPVQYFFSNGQVISHKALLLAAFLYGLEKRGQQLV